MLWRGYAQCWDLGQEVEGGCLVDGRTKMVPPLRWMSSTDARDRVTGLALRS